MADDMKPDVRIASGFFVPEFTVRVKLMRKI